VSESFGIEDYVQKGEKMSETIDGNGPYGFDKGKESDEKGFFVEPGGEGDVNYRSAETGQFVSEETAEANPDTTVREVDEDEENDAKMDAEIKTFDDLKKARLSRKRTVMTLNEEMDPGSGVPFCSFREDGSIDACYFMPSIDWEGFGKPQKITVGVVNGDILND
jgi:hypothetical protein